MSLLLSRSLSCGFVQPRPFYNIGFFFQTECSLLFKEWLINFYILVNLYLLVLGGTVVYWLALLLHIKKDLVI